MKEVKDYNPSEDPRLINCKTECGNDKCYARRYGLFAEKTCPNFVEQKLTTNADRIRSMTDEELADKFEEIQLKTVKAYGNDDLLLKGELKKYWLDWLKEARE